VVFDRQDRLLLIRRKHAPFVGAYALPGGFVDVGETVEAACRRELLEETGVIATKITLIGAYSDPKRDPRMHTCSLAYLVKARKYLAIAGDDADEVEWVVDWKRVAVAFDHRRIIADAARLLKSM
jgi:8-oxo-dGTP diphosphatase